MDRIDTMAAFVAVVDEGSLSGAARRLGRSPAAITRAIAALERHAGTRLLHRTTRVVALTEAGGRYLETCRRILAELEEADLLAAGERTTPHGTLAVTAPVIFGRLYVRPLVDAFRESHPTVRVKLLLFDRVANLIEEGLDAAVRIGHLPDSGLVAVKTGEVRRVVCASPDYLMRHKAPRVPADLVEHQCISCSAVTPTETWTFASASRSHTHVHVRVRAHLIVNQAEAAIDSALDGRGVTRVLSYQVERELRAGRLRTMLERFEPPPEPVHVIHPEARLAAAKVKAFVAFAVPRLKAEMTRIKRAIA
jgi:DNA-binding transcriptional LysR family regulator